MNAMMNAMTKTGFRVAVAAVVLLGPVALADDLPAPSASAGQDAMSMSVLERSLARYPTETVSRTIDVRHLDLFDAADARWVYRRILYVAKGLCWRPYESYRDLGTAERRSARLCFDQAVDGALAQVNAATGADLEKIAGLDRYHEAGVFASR